MLTTPATVGCWIFDLDGTLSNPAPGMLSSLNHALESHGFELIPAEKIETYIGPPLEESLAQLAGTHDTDIIKQLVQAYREHYHDEGYAGNELYDGIQSLLESLQKMRALMGVCTAKTEPIARKILDRFRIEGYFQFVSGGDVGVRKGQQLEKLLQSGDIDSTALMIGDRLFDLEAAHENGIRCCGVQWGFGPEAELVAATPTFLVSQPAELLALATARVAI